MKSIVVSIVAAVLLVGCGEAQQSAPAPEAKPVEPVAEAAKPEPTGVKAPDISIHDADKAGNIEAVKQHLAAGADVNAKGEEGTPLHYASMLGHKEVAGMLITNGANVNAKGVGGQTPLDVAVAWDEPEIADLLRKHGGKTAKELKAEGK